MIESTSDHRYHERGWTRPMPRTARKVPTHDVWAAGLNARIVERVTAARFRAEDLVVEAKPDLTPVTMVGALLPRSAATRSYPG